MQLEEFAEVIVADVKKRHQTCYRWRELSFIPDPERYLKNNRWNDDIVPYPAGGGRRAEIEDANKHTASAWANSEGEQDGKHDQD